MWGDEKQEKTRKSKKNFIETNRQMLFEKPLTLPEEVPSCVMIYGKDGTGKTGLSLSVLTDKDIKKGQKIVIVDLDSGNLPLLLEYHKDKVNKHILYRDPVVWETDDDGMPIINYKETIGHINSIAIAAKNRWKEKGDIKAIILDGGSKLLKQAEYQMRLDRYIEPAGEVSYRFWAERNKMFQETLELYKNLPFDKYFIMHEDFVPHLTPPSKEMAAVRQFANQMMYQKIYCERIDKAVAVEFAATIDKSKFSIGKEGKQEVFASANKSDESFKWEPEKILRHLKPSYAGDD